VEEALKTLGKPW